MYQILNIDLNFNHHIDIIKFLQVFLGIFYKYYKYPLKTLLKIIIIIKIIQLLHKKIYPIVI